ncbi:hypothetical protein [Tropicimonas sp. IMCC34011]|uniref:hypothetical protein n=1 Tax=Tropicimonas sp. IMCC34011 TaxID=2248759 RepID=UPI000E2882EF|nr:hypothetical protein [Tropicimonas sp. IMCC34011]
MRKTGDWADPKRLIAESYRIDGITTEECRSIFMDWAISLPAGSDPATAIEALLERHAEPGHPMTDVLREGLAAPQRTGRRGGPAARRRP